MYKYNGLLLKLNTLTVFRDILSEKPIKKLTELFACEDWDKHRLAELYCGFVNELYGFGESLAGWISDYISKDENAYVKCIISGRKPGKLIKESVERELKILGELSALDCGELIREIGAELPLPRWETESIDIAAVYRRRIREIPTKGYGVFAKYHMFTVDENGLVPVRRPDPQSLGSLYGYEKERAVVIKNTMALIEGKSANNCLLYGDAGTGKSSTVKAVANAFKDKGVRLIEVKKKQLYLLPSIMDELEGSPLKYIIFIDDLSFSQNDGDFAALKAILEGSVGSRGKNIVVYATSNRRHLIKESMEDRQGDDIHLSDTIQELKSLSARFGLTVTFMRPEKDLYLEIVENLAKEYNIVMDRQTLFVKAEAHAIRNGGRSPRAAKQFIEMLSDGVVQ